MNDDCLICAPERVDTATQVFADADWGAGVIDGFDVPGWIVLRTVRHAVGLPGLNARELASFGRRARDVVESVHRVTGSAATYLMSFGEAHPHFHALITPRTADIPLDRRTGDILKLRKERADRAAALALIPAIRAAYASLAAELVP